MSITPHMFRRVLELLGYLVRCCGSRSGRHKVWLGEQGHEGQPHDQEFQGKPGLHVGLPAISDVTGELALRQTCRPLGANAGSPATSACTGCVLA